MSTKYPSGASEGYTYYKNNQLQTLVNKKADSTVLESYSYTYDLANNQKTKSDVKGVTEYSYDALNRLSTVKEPGGRLTEYIFDMAGNRTSETITLGTQKTTTLYEYNEQNRMISTTAQVNNERNITKYSYDGNGNLTSKTREIFKKINPANPPTPHFGMFIPGQTEGGVTEYAKDIAAGICYYSYDKLNRMIKALPVGASAAEYRYNGDGLRVEKIADGKTTRYMYEYDKVVLELDGKGRQTARNVQGLNPISRTVDGTTMYYLYNGHADVTALIDGAGAIQSTYYYDAFGNIAETTGTVNNPFTYAGYQYDKETGLYYLNARMYDPKIARFMQEDSYAGEFNDPLSLNLYTYCHNEPIMYTDPTGHRNVSEADSGGGSKPSTSGKGNISISSIFNSVKKDVKNVVKKVADTLTSLGKSSKKSDSPEPVVVKSASQVGKNTSITNNVYSTLNKIEQIIDFPTKILGAFIDGEAEYMTEQITPFISGDILEDGYKKGEYISDTIINSLAKKEDPVTKFKEDGINTANNIANNAAEGFKNEVINGNYESRAKYLAKIVVNVDMIILANRYSGSTGNVRDSIPESVSSGGVAEAGTLSNVEARTWYLSQEKKIPGLIDKNLSLEQQANQAFDLRNQFRTQARDLMADRELAAKLMREEPNLSWEQVVQKAQSKGFTGDDIYKYIIDSSQRSRTSVNQSLGLDK